LTRSRSAAAARAIADSASTFAALGDPTRLRLVSRLTGRGPLSITQLADGLPITRQAVTKHLRVMEDAGVVRSAPRGRERVWQLDERRLQLARRHLETISREWDRRLARLEAFVAGGPVSRP
jgi:DNA-binding transcriptional ArsR family regulator